MNKIKLGKGIILDSQKKILQMPESFLRLGHSALEILSNCNGDYTVTEIIQLVQKKYPSIQHQKIEKDIHHFVHLLDQKMIFEYVPHEYK